MKQVWKFGILLLAYLPNGGCQTESQQLADLADRTVEMQAQQNLAIAKSQGEMIELSRDIQLERKELNQGFKQLEDDRQKVHKQRRSELAWAESLRFLALVIAASMPLFLCAYLVWAGSQNVPDSQIINEVLMQELVTQKPRLLTGPNLTASHEDQAPVETKPNRIGFNNQPDKEDT